MSLHAATDIATETGGGERRAVLGLALGWLGCLLFYAVVLAAALLPVAALGWLVVALIG